jgi:hypothetical protein
MRKIVLGILTILFLAGITLISVGATLAIVPMVIGGIALIAGSSVGYIFRNM